MKPCRSISHVVLLSLAERQKGLAQLLYRIEMPHPERVFLERPDEPFGAAIAFRRTDEGRGAFDAVECDLPFWK